METRISLSALMANLCQRRCSRIKRGVMSLTDTCIILIGPMGVGKTSAAKELSEITGLEYIDVDELRWGFFSAQPDYDGEMVDDLFGDSKEEDAFRYMKPFEARLVLYVLDNYQSGIFDFGAGYTVYDDIELFEKVKTAFVKYSNVFFLRYSDDKDESLAALSERHTDIPKEVYYSLNRGFIESPCNEILATYTIDTARFIRNVSRRCLRRRCLTASMSGRFLPAPRGGRQNSRRLGNKTFSL